MEEQESTTPTGKQNSEDLQEQLLESLLARDISKFSELLKNPNVNLVHKYGPPHWSSCLEIACRKAECEEFVRALLVSGVKPNINAIVPEPIHYAASKGNDKTLKVLLLDKRTKLNAVDSYGRTALHLAAKNFGQGENSARYERCIALLMSRSEMDVNRPNKKGCTAIYEAASYGGRDAVLAMLKHGSHVLDLDSARGIGRSAREVILERYPDLNTILPPPKLEQLQSNSYTQLLAAFQHRQLNVFRDLLCQVDMYGNARIDPNNWYSKPYNATCLEMACKEIGCEEFVNALLLAGADPNTVNIITHKSPIHLAVEAGNHEAMKILLQDRRTNINMVDDSGKTALHIAVEIHKRSDDEDDRRSLECISLLLHQENIDVNKVDKNGYTAIQIAALKKNPEALRIILEHDGHELDLDSLQGVEQKSTRDIITEKFPYLKKLLPQKSFLEDRESTLRETLFQHLHRRQTDEFIQMFKENVNKCNTLALQEMNDGYYTLLQYASNHGLKDVVKVLLEFKADPNATTDYDKRPPVILACLRQNKDILKSFLQLHPESKFNINAPDARGNTALHYAAHNEDLDSVVALLSHGADIKLRNVFDQTPLPVSAVETLLNYSLKTSHHFPDDEDYELIFNYSFLLAHTRQDNLGKSTSQEDAVPLVTNQDEESIDSNHEMQVLTPEMDLLYHFSQSAEHRKLLTHPIVTSFLHLKWFRIRATYFTSIVLYVLFLILLNIYIFMDYGLPSYTNSDLNAKLQNVSTEADTIEEDQETHLERFRTTYGNLIWILLLLILFCHTLRELFKFVMSPSRYLLTLDTMLDIALVFITAIVLFKSWDEDENRRLFTAFSLFLSWIELALLIGRLPQLSKNIEMMKSVALYYCYIFLSYAFFIIAFAVSFYILYHDNVTPDNNNHNFHTLRSSLSQTIMLMADGSYMSSISTVGYSTIMFLLFVFLISLVMLNILIGIGVNIVKNAQDNAEMLCVVSKITLLYEIESTLIYWNRFMEKICKLTCVSKMASYLNNALKKAILFPNISPSEKQVSVLLNINSKIVFPNKNYATNYRMDLKTLNAAISIISEQKEISDVEQINKHLQQTHNESLQKIADNSNNIDKMQNKFHESHKKLEIVEESIKNFQNKMDNNHRSLEKIIKKFTDLSELQFTHSQKSLKEKFDKYDEKFEWVEESQKRTTDLLTQILETLNNSKSDL
ncbi:transient receptor potential cation channel protein painless-like [Periplaneta americana]|uniref:transient receptor potential cation channel protein painless-like n=1 Tax=Periplaneta americana TaxID=6978 RepID=UPI0037E74902